jgi:alpha-L-fucosidase
MATSWSYVPNDTYKSANELIEKLVDIVSKGGNFLLNIGPGPDGELDPVAYERLNELGSWMKINGEAIYNSRMYSVYSDGEKVRYTQSKDHQTLYVFLFDYLKGPLILNNAIVKKGSKIVMLGSNEALTFKNLSEGIEIILPQELENKGKYVWVFKISLKK